MLNNASNKKDPGSSPRAELLHSPPLLPTIATTTINTIPEDPQSTILSPSASVESTTPHIPQLASNPSDRLKAFLTAISPLIPKAPKNKFTIAGFPSSFTREMFNELLEEVKFEEGEMEKCWFRQGKFKTGTNKTYSKCFL
jgi:hypothetical protein